MPDMYAIQPSSKATQSEKDDSALQYTPNIIPCRIHHDGPVDSLNRYWTPVKEEKGTKRVSSLSKLRLKKALVQIIHKPRISVDANFEVGALPFLMVIEVRQLPQ
jgi:hypothetical protein